MNTHQPNLSLTPLVWVCAVCGAALAAFVCAPYALDYPLAALGILAFLAVQVFLPACRPNTQTPLCPGNIAQLVFWVQLVLTPVLIGYYGPVPGTLPNLPSLDAINFAICLRVLGYVSFCVAFQIFAKPPQQDLPPEPSETPWTAPTIVAFAGIGFVGWLLYYGGVGGFIELASSPAEQREREMEAATMATAAGNFLRHFLGFAIVWAWSAWVVGRKRIVTLAATAGAVAVLMLVNFSYNRGNMLAPVLALTAAYSVHVRRLSFGFLACAGAAVLAAAFTFGWYRSTNMQLSDVSAADLGQSFDDDKSVIEFVQVYANGPQFTGFLVDQLDIDNKSYHGATLIPSLLYPVPVVGRPFREQSGLYIYNEMIYGDPEVLDQTIPYDAELYMNFNVIGVALGYGLLGFVQAFLQGRFQSARVPIESYAWLVLGLWTVFPGSFPVLSQMFTYSFWPIYTYLMLKLIMRPMPTMKGLVAT